MLHGVARPLGLEGQLRNHRIRGKPEGVKPEQGDVDPHNGIGDQGSAGIDPFEGIGGGSANLDGGTVL